MISFFKLKNNIQIIFYTTLFITFFIDSGNRFGLRNAALILLVFIGCIKIYKLLLRFPLPSFDKDIVFHFLYSLLFFLYAWTVSFYFYESFYSHLKYYLVIILLPFFLGAFLHVNANVIYRAFYLAVISFAFINVITYLIGLYYSDIFILFFNVYNVPGFFRIEDTNVVVYYQSNLFLAPIAVYFLLKNNIYSFLFLGFVLILVNSDFGVIILILGMLIKLFNLEKIASYNFTKYFLLMSFGLVVMFFVVYLYTQIAGHKTCYLYDFSGILTRYGHLISIFDGFALNVNQFVFGVGAHSEFYSYGTCKIENDIEISQLELIRRYGIIGYTFYSILFFYLLKYLNKVKNYAATISLFIFYISFISNPGLISLAFPLMSAIFIVDSRHFQGKLK